MAGLSEVLNGRDTMHALVTSFEWSHGYLGSRDGMTCDVCRRLVRQTPADAEASPVPPISPRRATRVSYVDGASGHPAARRPCSLP
jgi:hypothetical protein